MKKRKPVSLLCSLVLFGFLLGIHDGKLALWQGEDPIPYKTFPYPAAILPQELQQALQQGIPIERMEDLQELLEKYLP